MGDERSRAAGLVADQGRQGFAVGAEDNKRWVTFDVKSALQGRVLLRERGGKGFVCRKVQLDEDKIGVGVGLERRCVERLLIHLDAPFAPVGAGEVEQHQFVLQLGLGLGGGKIREPIGPDRGAALTSAGGDEECAQGERE